MPDLLCAHVNVLCHARANTCLPSATRRHCARTRFHAGFAMVMVLSARAFSGFLHLPGSLPPAAAPAARACCCRSPFCHAMPPPFVRFCSWFSARTSSPAAHTCLLRTFCILRFYHTTTTTFYCACRLVHVPAFVTVPPACVGTTCAAAFGSFAFVTSRRHRLLLYRQFLPPYSYPAAHMPRLRYTLYHLTGLICIYAHLPPFVYLRAYIPYPSGSFCRVGLFTAVLVVLTPSILMKSSHLTSLSHSQIHLFILD